MSLQLNKKSILFLSSAYPADEKLECWIKDDISCLSKGFKCYLASRRYKSHKAWNVTGGITALDFDLRSILSHKFLLSFGSYFFEYLILCSRQYAGLVDLIARLFCYPRAIDLLLRAKDLDVSHIHVYTTSSPLAIGLFLAKRLGSGFSFVIHTTGQVRHLKWQRQYRYIVSQASSVRVIAQCQAAEVISFLNLNSHEANKVSFVPLGVSVKLSERDIRIRQNKPESLRDREPLRVISIGRLCRYKGFHIIPQIVEHFIIDGEDIVWDVYGDGPLRSVIESEIAELGLSKYIRLRGFVDQSDLDKIIVSNDYDCLVMTSEPTGQPEGVPIAMIRAILLSIPVITSQSGSITSVVRNKENALVLEEYSPKQFASALRFISQNPQQAKSMARMAYVDISRIYSCQAILDGFKRLVSS